MSPGYATTLLAVTNFWAFPAAFLSLSILQMARYGSLAAAWSLGKRPRDLTALPYRKVEAAITSVRNSGAWSEGNVAFEFLVPTVCRSGQVRLSEWRGVVVESGVWTIPPDQSKIRREQEIRLAPRAFTVLEEARQLSHGEG